MSKKLIKKVKKSFKAHFERKPLMVFSPGRINLIGEHTDYNDGFAFPAAINKGIALAITTNTSDSCHVYALNKNEHADFKVSNISPIENGGWRNYILGVVAEILKLGISVGNFNAVFAGNIPAGAGMSSSAALENAFVFGLNKLFKLGLSKNEMILISQKAEHNYANVQCGIMDQYASMYGAKHSALLLDCRKITSTPYQIDFGKYRLLLINSNVKHNLSETAYNDRRAVCEKVSKQLKISKLRDTTLEGLELIRGEISSEDFEKALYVIEENNRVIEFSKAIKSNDLEYLGKLLYLSHEGLSNQFNVSCEELDFLVDFTKNDDRVLGSRMMGGGFCGCTINLVLKSALNEFTQEISESYKSKFEKHCSVYKVKLSKGTRVIKNK